MQRMWGLDELMGVDVWRMLRNLPFITHASPHPLLMCMCIPHPLISVQLKTSSQKHTNYLELVMFFSFIFFYQGGLIIQHKIYGQTSSNMYMIILLESF